MLNNLFHHYQLHCGVSTILITGRNGRHKLFMNLYAIQLLLLLIKVDFLAISQIPLNTTFNC
jgi:hypothetical protein